MIENVAGVKFVVGVPKGKTKSEVQSVLFDKDKFTKVEAEAWLKEHDFKNYTSRETEGFLRFRQRDDKDFQEDSFKTISNEAHTMTTNEIVEKDGKWYVYSKDKKKKLGGPYDSEGEANKRMSQVEYFKNNQFTSFTFNLKAQKAQVRHDTMEGREWLVVPCVMMTVGVHEGSEGPLFYPKDELSKTPAVWNGKPVVVYHPQLNGSSISACDPEIFTKQKIGLLMNTRWDKDRLVTECWLEEDKTRLVDERVLNAIEQGAMMEVSTGLFTDNEAEDGEWNGEAYKAIARNYRPDHLAILPDLKGACSIADGAGLLRNAAAGEDSTPESLLARSLVKVFNELSHSEVWRKLNDKIRGTTGPMEVGGAWVNEVWDNFFIYEDKGKTYYQEYSMDDKGDAKLVGIRKEAEKKVSYQLPDGTLVGNAVMRTDGGLKYPAAAYAYVPDPEMPSTWKIRLWETPDKKETAAQIGRAIAAVGKGFRGQKVQLPADAIKGVKAKIRAAWKRVNPEKDVADMPEVLNNSKKEDFAMDKKQMVDGLIANTKSPWSEEDREMLMGLSDEQLATINVNQASDKKEEGKKDDAPAAPAKDAAPAAPATNVAATVEEFIAGAPEGMRDMLRAGLQAYGAEKAGLIKKITANERNPFTPEQLQTKAVEELRGLARLAEVPKAPAAPMAPHFGGMAEVSPVGNQDGVEEPLVAPVLNFGDNKE